MERDLQVPGAENPFNKLLRVRTSRRGAMLGVLAGSTLLVGRRRNLSGIVNASTNVIEPPAVEVSVEAPASVAAAIGPDALTAGVDSVVVNDPPIAPDAPVTIFQIPHTTIAEENAKDGHDGWRLTRPDSTVVAFTVPSSVTSGESLKFHVASGSSRYKLSVYRLGWYGGKGGRLMYEKDAIVSPRVSTAVDPKTRTTIASWGPSHSVDVPDDWRSGIYVAVATASNGGQSLTPFWIRSKEAVAPAIASSGLLTAAAYNNWTLSLYGGATAVGLDRPNRARGGAGEVLPWDLALVRHMERSGIDTDYMADVDSHDHEDIYNGRKLIALMGHHEYYSAEMRQRIEKAVAEGVNIAVFGANAIYWRIRLENSAFGTNRIVVCYKNGRDPDSENPTGRFRDQGNHEARLLGVAYEQTSAGDDWVVANPQHWVFENTGLGKGDRLKRLIGPEYDSIMDRVPPSGAREILAESTVNPGPKQGHSYACMVTNESGARIFTVGSLDWVFGLDDYRLGFTRNYQIPVDERAQKIASNVLIKLSETT